MHTNCYGDNVTRDVLLTAVYAHADTHINIPYAFVIYLYKRFRLPVYTYIQGA